MWNKRKNYFLKFGIVIIMIFGAVAMHAEDITLTTYYPVPYGVYRELRSQRMVIGANWFQASDYSLPTSSNLAVQGNVAIGNMNALSPLHINCPDDIAPLAAGNRVTLANMAAYGGSGVAIGHSAFAYSDFMAGCAIGNAVNAHDTRAIVIGSGGYAHIGLYASDDEVIFGNGNSSGRSVCAGRGAYVGYLGGYSVSIGAGSTANGLYNVVIGTNATAPTASGGRDSVVIGFEANASPYSTAVGAYANASGMYSLALGGDYSAAGANASGLYSIALGWSSKASTEGGIAAGVCSNTSADYAGIAIGAWANAGRYSAAIGPSAIASSNYCVALGSASRAKDGYRSVAVGRAASALGGYSLALGSGASAGSASRGSSTAIGAGASAYGQYYAHINLGSGGPIAYPGTGTEWSGWYVTGGSVGVNTNSPGCRLEVVDTGDKPYIALHSMDSYGLDANYRAGVYFKHTGEVYGTNGWVLGRDSSLNLATDICFYCFDTATFGPIIKSNGAVIIGGSSTTTASGKLHVVGTITATGPIYCTSWSSSSSIKGKDHVQYFNPARYYDILNKVNDTDIATYYWKNSSSGMTTQKKHIGVIVEYAPSEIVTSDKERVNHSDYLGFLFAAIKAQQMQIKEFKENITREISRQQKDIEQLKKGSVD